MVPIPLDEELKSKVRSPKRQWGASWCEQYSILFWRGIKERRHDYFSWLRITQVLSTAIILGLLWWQSDANNPKGLQDQVNYFCHSLIPSLKMVQSHEQRKNHHQIPPSIITRIFFFKHKHCKLTYSPFFSTGRTTFLYCRLLGILSCLHCNIHISSRESHAN